MILTETEVNKIIATLGLTKDTRPIPSRLIYKGLPLGETYSCWDGTYAIELFTKRESMYGFEYSYYHERVDTVEDFWRVFNEQALPAFKKAYKLQQLERIREDCD
jgi:hypothetical protein